MMTSALDDIIVVIEWLGATKTATGRVAEALERLRNRSQQNIPVDVKLPTEKQDGSNNTT